MDCPGFGNQGTGKPSASNVVLSIGRTMGLIFSKLQHFASLTATCCFEKSMDLQQYTALFYVGAKLRFETKANHKCSFRLPPPCQVYCHRSNTTSVAIIGHPVIPAIVARQRTQTVECEQALSHWVHLQCRRQGIVYIPLITRFMGPIWGPPGADRTQVGPMLAPWTLLSVTFLS